ncbi:DUF397 domain-containing protein [Streptomyces sp. NPDC045470]|uniref:DUF397 domain-containing protein n=1 Tax=unclassified Streptomyces TaxID=2593676 RepID=UPI0033DB4F2D
MSQLTWQRSSFSEGGADTCVEVAAGCGDVRWVRESAEGGVVRVSVGALGGLVRVLKVGAVG